MSLALVLQDSASPQTKRKAGYGNKALVYYPCYLSVTVTTHLTLSACVSGVGTLLAHGLKSFNPWLIGFTIFGPVQGRSHGLNMWESKAPPYDSWEAKRETRRSQDLKTPFWCLPSSLTLSGSPHLLNAPSSPNVQQFPLS